MLHLEFKSLSYETQAEVVCKNGVYIAERKVQSFEVILYQIDGFYVEVFYHTKEKITVFKCFDNPNLLQPYLKKISLKGLF